MASRSATVLTIFVIAIVAFCLASVCASMTGTISILPNGTGNNHTILDNLSAITDGTGDSGKSYGHEGPDYSSSSDSKVETTTDDSSSSSHDNSNPSTDDKTDGGGSSDSSGNGTSRYGSVYVVTYSG